MAHASNHSNHHNHEAHGSNTTYISGYLFSILLTILPLWFVLNHSMSKDIIIYLILFMAVLQFLIQLIFFMHIRESQKPRYNVLALIFGAIFVFTIVAGSAWIMTFNSQVQ